MNKVEVTAIHPTDVRKYWRHAEPHLKDAIALSGGRWTEPYILAALVLGEQTLWLVHRDNDVIAALTTEIIQYPEKRAVGMHFMGGSGFDEFFPIITKKIIEYAKANNCDVVESNARLGFWKWFKTIGFEKPSVFYELRIN